MKQNGQENLREQGVSEMDRWEIFIETSITTSKTISSINCCFELCDLFRKMFDTETEMFQDKYLNLVAMADRKRTSILAEEEEFLKFACQNN